jgi:hypothetical protein
VIGDKLMKKTIMTAISQITGYMSLANAQMLGQDLMEITAHAGARSSHAEWQGQIVSLSGRRGYLSLDDIGYGQPDGFKGVNCRHDWYPFFEGISERTYTDEQLNNIDPPPFEFEGKTYTAYEASQKQRQIERAIRKTKRELIAYEAAGLKDDFTAASIKLRRQRELYRDFSRAANLREKLERTGIYGYNKNISSKSVWVERKEREYLQKQLPYVINGEKGFIPTNTKFEITKIIAGGNSGKKLRNADNLAKKYGDNPQDWIKKVGKIESSKYIFDVHWYELNGIQYEAKLKYRREKK